MKKVIAYGSFIFLITLLGAYIGVDSRMNIYEKNMVNLKNEISSLENQKISLLDQKTQIQTKKEMLEQEIFKYKPIVIPEY